ncbi:3-hydroxybutyrate dehydrogenase [Umezawaea tangerina]|nr:3-hydroxybutyrate dehydrogenase [Umezawaea tangerina]
MNSGLGHTGEGLAGRTALITGAGGGIGRACALAFAEAGAKIHLVDRDDAAVRAVAEEVEGTTHVVDLSAPDPVRDLPRDVDVLVNNAGLQHVAPIHDFPPERFELMQRVMVTAPFLLMRHCLPHMYERGWGRIVNLTSVHGLRASAFKSAYTAAKHGLEGLSKVAALEGAEHGVTSNCVSPGYVRTPLVEGQVADQARAHGIPEDRVLAEVMLQRTAIKRLIEPVDIAATVLWLCGANSGHVTGTTFTIDGGWSAQ